MDYLRKIILIGLFVLYSSSALATDFSTNYHWQIPEPGEKPYYTSFLSLINAIDLTVKTNHDSAVPVTRSIFTSTGLQGGGVLTNDLTFTLSNTAVTPGTYTYVSLTVDQQGRLTAASSGTIPAPSNAGYWVDTANDALTSERNLGALTTGLVLNTVTTGVGVPSAYAGSSCTNQFVRSLNASGAATCATVGSSDLAAGLSLASPVATTKIGLPRVTSFPSSPSAGDTVIVTNDSAIGACNPAAGSAQTLCQYNGSAWVSLGDGGSGGSSITAATASVAASESTTSTTFTDLATSGPAVTLTIGPSGNAIIYIAGLIWNASVSEDSFMGVALSGGNTVAASSNYSLTTRGGSVIRAGFTYMLTGLTAASTTFTAKYKANVGTAYFQDRILTVMTW